MRIERRVDTSSIPEESRGRDAEGRVIQAGPDGPEAIIVVQDDGTEQRVPARQDLASYSKPLPVILPAQHLDSLTVAQIAVHRVLSGTVFYGINLEQFIDTAVVDSKQFKLSSVFFDWASAEGDAQPQVAVALRQAGFLGYTNPGLNTTILEETIDVFMKGTALRRTATASVPLVAEFVTADKEERRGIRAGLERVFLTELHDDRENRRVVVKEYFDQEARIVYKGQDQEDLSENAQANRWFLQARFEVVFNVVELVGTPEIIESVGLELTVNGEC